MVAKSSHEGSAIVAIAAAALVLLACGRQSDEPTGSGGATGGSSASGGLGGTGGGSGGSAGSSAGGSPGGGGAAGASVGGASGAAASNGIWISTEEIMARPTSGVAWDNVLEMADAPLGVANLADQDSSHGMRTYALALVAVRLADSARRAKAVDAILSAIGTDENADLHCDFTPSKARSMAIGRRLAAYVIAADVLVLRKGTDGGKGDQWQSYVELLRFKKNCPNTGSGSYPNGDWFDLSQAHDQAGSNGNAVAGASRIAAAAYLGDKAELDKAWETYRRYSGECSGPCGLQINAEGVSWSSDPAILRPINPKGATKLGHSIDGAIIADQGRGGAFTWPPGYTHYPWEGLQGYFAQAHLLARQGYPAWQIADSAPRRAVDYQYFLAQETGNAAWSEGGTKDHYKSWVVWLANGVYGTSHAAGQADGGYIGFTDWTYVNQ